MANRERAKMQNFTGSCLYRSLAYESKTAALRTFNYHYEDCRKCSGAPYLITNMFVKEATLDIQANLKSYIHQSESGKKITEKFCEK